MVVERTGKAGPPRCPPTGLRAAAEVQSPATRKWPPSYGGSIKGLLFAVATPAGRLPRARRILRQEEPFPALLTIAVALEPPQFAADRSRRHAPIKLADVNLKLLLSLPRPFPQCTFNGVTQSAAGGA